jgi:hypothetical protein
MVSIAQHQHDDLRHILAWDSGIAGLSISLSDIGEWTFVGGSCSKFPLSFSVERSVSLEGSHEGLAIPHFGIRMSSLWRLC